MFVFTASKGKNSQDGTLSLIHISLNLTPLASIIFLVRGCEMCIRDRSLDREYNSDNTERLNIEQIKEKLLSLEYIKQELGAMGTEQ